ncbi:glucosamine-6-phosphate isomerase [Gimesia sp.]|uniref:6-phosphogluconolactonase n=1 Tax=Gimesia sp. TaxID=2024833 RepID=UPI000C64B317|nr:glucosamine-6-phosphate isomerase [Gimesia sp.]MAX37585.1 glucosamine-6-phosphate isomerase [Gimesia sp.]HAH47335.1 glucosamine-6-phosphate isomerase [Planctomycetaceae bacterium]|tara:strand:- start:58361 stop:59209 length:849 start_codon:yes stop_codon:yes gene_type:complete
MTFHFPDYLDIRRNELATGTSVKFSVVKDMPDIAQHMAIAMLRVIETAEAKGKPATLIVPVGPVDQYPILADMINQQQYSVKDVMLINMDEYLTDDDQWVDLSHPLSFRGYMNRKFYDLLKPDLAPLPENRICPDPNDVGAILKMIEQRGGVDACFGGIGINGHIAFNEPPEADQTNSAEEFAQLSTRNLDLTRETRTINSVTVGGEISIIPWRAVTIGMKEILSAAELHFYCNRIWQSSVVRRVLHGPVTSDCPASLLQTHPAASLTVAEYVAEPPDIRLR